MSTMIGSLRLRIAAAGFRYPSLFWPPVLICLGVMTWLWNQDVLTPAGMTIFVRLWPLLLIGAGLDVLVARSRPAASAALGIGLPALALVLVFAGPRFGLGGDLETYHFSESVGPATSAQIAVYSQAGHLHVDTLAVPGRLVSADVTDTTMPDFTVSGLDQKVVAIGHPESSTNTGYFDLIGRQTHVQISKVVPTALDLQLGSGITTLHLQDAQLTNLQISNGSGRVDADLPVLREHAQVALSSGSGIMNVHVPPAASLDLTTSLGSGRVSADIGPGADLIGQLTGGSGSFSIQVPSGTALRISVTSHLERLNLPSDLTRVSGPSDDDQQGIWESAGFEQAPHQVSLNITLGSGALRVSE